MQMIYKRNGASQLEVCFCLGGAFIVDKYSVILNRSHSQIMALISLKYLTKFSTLGVLTFIMEITIKITSYLMLLIKFLQSSHGHKFSTIMSHPRHLQCRNIL